MKPLLAIFIALAFTAPDSFTVSIKHPEPQFPTFIATVYAYSSTPDQTDDTPFETASGRKVRRGIAANNCLGFGSIVSIGGTIYEIQDVMNIRYDCKTFDLWHPTREEASNFGKQDLEVKIIKPVCDTLSRKQFINQCIAYTHHN